MIEIIIQDIEKEKIVYSGKHKSIKDFVHEISVDEKRNANTQELTYIHLYGMGF